MPGVRGEHGLPARLEAQRLRPAGPDGVRPGAVQHESGRRVFAGDDPSKAVRPLLNVPVHELARLSGRLVAGDVRHPRGLPGKPAFDDPAAQPQEPRQRPGRVAPQRSRRLSFQTTAGRQGNGGLVGWGRYAARRLLPRMIGPADGALAATVGKRCRWRRQRSRWYVHSGTRPWALPAQAPWRSSGGGAGHQ